MKQKLPKDWKYKPLDEDEMRGCAILVILVIIIAFIVIVFLFSHFNDSLVYP